MLRRRGAHELVNMVRRSRLKRLAYGAPPKRDHRQQIREQAVKFFGHLNADK